MGGSYICKDQKESGWGYTTGACTAAASLAATVMLLQSRRMEQVSLTTPKGTRLGLEVEEIGLGKNSVSCGVRKDAGDDPDVTDGFTMYSQIRLPDADGDDASCAGRNYVYEKGGLRLYLSGGVGMGMITQCGLSREVGKVAINPAPRKMMFEQVAGVYRGSGFKGVLSIEIRVPRAFEATHRTLNGRLGVREGMSILETSGIVEPMSEAALLDTIRLELRQRTRKGEKNLLVIPGSYGESFVGSILELGLEQAVKCSNSISSTIDMAAEKGAESTLLAGHGGKLIKLAMGIMNTHSSWVDGKIEILAAHGAAYGIKRELVEQILEAVTVNGELRLLGTEDGLHEQVMRRVMGRLEQHMKRRAGEGLKAEAIVLTNERGILGATTGADDLFMYFTDRMRGR